MTKFLDLLEKENVDYKLIRGRISIDYLYLGYKHNLNKMPSNLSINELVIMGCDKLKELPENIEIKSSLFISDCKVLERLPSKLDVKYLKLQNVNSLEELPSDLISLEKLIIDNCNNIQSLPELPSLTGITIKGCRQLKEISETFQKGGFSMSKYKNNPRANNQKALDVGTLGYYIREARNNAGLTQSRTDELLGWGSSLTSAYERGVKTPNRKNLSQLEKLYNVPTGTLLSKIGYTIDTTVQSEASKIVDEIIFSNEQEITIEILKCVTDELISQKEKIAKLEAKLNSRISRPETMGKFKQILEIIKNKF